MNNRTLFFTVPEAEPSEIRVSAWSCEDPLPGHRLLIAPSYSQR